MRWRSADLPGRLRLTIRLRLTTQVWCGALGDVTVTQFTLAADRWKPVTGEGENRAVSLPAASPTLLRAFGGHAPAFFEEGIPQQPDLPSVGLRRSGALCPFFQVGQPGGLLTAEWPAGHRWTAAEQAVFRAAGGALALALGHGAGRDRRRRPVRQGDDEAALETFAAFTERAAAETDVLALSREVYAVMDVYFGASGGAYYESRDGLWKAVTWTPELTSGQIAMICAGLPLDVPSFVRAMQTRLPVFIDGWDPASEQVENTAESGPVCIYPLVVGTWVRGIFTVGLRVGETWRDRDRGLMRALGGGSGSHLA